MTAASLAASTIRLNSPCNSTAPGVVWVASIRSFPIT